MTGLKFQQRVRNYADRSKISRQIIVGMILVILCWILNWSLTGLRTHLLFFPLWLGYCLVVDGLVRWRTGSSLLTRNPMAYVLLFFLSAPVWWLFEGLNLITRNWSYLGRENFSDFQYFLFATISFSTVMPAVFSTAEFLGTFSWINAPSWKRQFFFERSDFWKLHIAGWVMLILMTLIPNVFFPFMWLSLFFIIDSLNALMGRRSMLEGLKSGYIQPFITYGLAALGCGFFWEMWNVYSYPKWIYSIPYLDQIHIFEMPLAGYGGYVPFGWELFALYTLVSGILSRVPRH